MEVLKTDWFGFGIGYDYVKKEMAMHLFIWSFEFKL